MCAYPLRSYLLEDLVYVSACMSLTRVMVQRLPENARPALEEDAEDRSELSQTDA